MNPIIKFISNLMSWDPEKAQEMRYLFLDMSGVTDDNAAILKEASEQKEEHHLKVVLCPDKKSHYNEEKLITMGVRNLVDHIYNPGTLGDEFPDDHTSDITKNNKRFWCDITLDGKKLNPNYIFLIDNQLSMCKALRSVKGTAYHYTNEYDEDGKIKNDTASKNARAVQAFKEWLEQPISSDQNATPAAGSCPG